MNYYEVDAISNTSLGYFLKSPLHYYNYINKKQTDKDSDSFGLGNICHKYLLERDKFEDIYTVMMCKKIEGMMGKFIEELVFQEKTEVANEETLSAVSIAHNMSGFKQSLETVLKNFEKDENKAYYNYLHSLDSKLPCSVEELEIVKRIENSIKNHKSANNFIYPKEGEGIIILTEVECYWKVEIDGEIHDCKAKLDRVIIDVNKRKIKVVELKTTGYPVRTFEKEIKYYRYYRQASWYKNEALKELLKQYNLEIKDFTVESYIVAVETKDLYQVRVIKLSEVDLIQGEIEYSWILEQISWHTKNNFWFKKDYYYKDDWIDEVNIFQENKAVNDKTDVTEEVYTNNDIHATSIGEAT